MQTNLLGSYAHTTSTASTATTLDGCPTCQDGEADPSQHHHRRIAGYYDTTTRPIVAAAILNEALTFFLATRAGDLIQEDARHIRLCAPERCPYCARPVAVLPHTQRLLDADPALASTQP